tara:strand:- start:30879 stop:31556 length:678 start_codon:yes stop_codon:yes gene_type:complete
MIVSIHQPAYLPWLGYFDKVSQADLFVYLDTVQYQKNSFQNRNKIKTSTGPIWLTVPIKKSNIFQSTLQKTEIDNQINWRKKHINSIVTNYSKAPFFDLINNEFLSFYDREWEYLSDMCYEMLVWFMQILNINTRIIKSSQLGSIEGNKSLLILNICKTLNASTYLSGALGRDYLEEETFLDNSINIEYQDYDHPEYSQLYNTFEKNMAAIDLLANESNPHKYFK